jgi:hypothetical protein
LPGAREDDRAVRNDAAEALTDADSQYLAEIWSDCEGLLGSGTELLDLRREPSYEGVSLVARYRLGEHDRESAAAGRTLLAAHSALRERIVINRVRFGFSDIVEDR